MMQFQMELHLDDRDGYSFRKTIPVVYSRRLGDSSFAFDPVGSELAPEAAAEWWRIPNAMLIEGEVWEYGVLLSAIGVPDDLSKKWSEEYQRLRRRTRSDPALPGGPFGE